MKKNSASRGEVVLYQAPNGAVRLDVRLEQDTLWLTQKQMALLFDKDADTIGLHLRNIFDEGELEESATTEESSVVQIEGNRRVRRKLRIYNLDAIISIGYRINSKRGTQFRIWATKVLKDHILKGYTVNQKRLKELNQAIRLIADTAERRNLSTDEAKALLRVVGEYGRALDLLDDYDHQRVTEPTARRRAIYPEKLERLNIPDWSDRADISRQKFLARLSGEISKRGIIDVLRKDIDHGPVHLDFFYGTPSPGNERAAAYQISQATRDRLPDIPWDDIVGMRHRLVHTYFDINLDVLWKTVLSDLPPLTEALRNALGEK
jgi:hypothetical protein